MRVDSDNYVWGVAKIVIERKLDDPDNQRTQIHLYGPDGEEANCNLAIWGTGTMAKRGMPEIVLIEGETEKTLVEGVKE